MRVLRSRLMPVVVALCLFATLAAACGSDSTGDGPPAGSVSSPVAEKTIPADAHVIDEDNLAFKPGSLSISSGDTVYFKNSESAIHNVEVDGGLKSPDMRKGQIFSYVFNDAGKYKITCEYHPQMRSTITVN